MKVLAYNTELDGYTIKSIRTFHNDWNEFSAIEAFHPLELDSEILNDRCVSHYLSYGIMYALWSSLREMSIVDVTNRKLLSKYYYFDNAKRRLEQLLEC